MSRALAPCTVLLLALGLAGCQSDDASDASAPESPRSTSTGTAAVAATGATLPTPAEVKDATAAAERAVPALFAIGYRDFDEQVKAAKRLMTTDAMDEYDEWAKESRGDAMERHANRTTDIVRSGIAATDVDTVVVMSFVDWHGSTGVEPSTWTDEITIILTMVRDGGHDAGDWKVGTIEFFRSDAHDADPSRHAVTTVAWDIAESCFTIDARTWDNWLEDMQTRVTGDWFDGLAARMKAIVTAQHWYWRGGPRAIAVETLEPNRAVVLVSVSGVEGRSDVVGQPADDEAEWWNRFQLTLRKVDGRWLMSDLEYVTEPDTQALPLV